MRLIQGNHDRRTYPMRKRPKTRFAWRNHILMVTEVPEDGHSGFQAIAFHLNGRERQTDTAIQRDTVRKDLL